MSDVKFNIYSGALKALDVSDNADGHKRLKTTASSTIRDLPGDEMTVNALQSMARTAEGNMTIFLNHKYQVPEDVLGSVEKATVEARGEEYDLDFVIRVNEANPRALQTWDAIQGGTQLGTSIGALIPEGSVEKTATGLKIDDVKLLEASIVGIPANPRSFVHYAMKAFKTAEAEEEAEESGIEVSGPPMKIHVEKAEISGLPSVEAPQQAASIPDGATWDSKAQVWVTVDTDDAKTRGEGSAAAPAIAADDSKNKDKSKGKASTSKRDADPDTTKETAPPEGDEGTQEPEAEPASEQTPATQDAPESTPESDGTPADKADGDELIERQKALGIEALSGLTRSMAHELIDTKKALKLETAKTAALEERVSQAEGNVLVAKQIVERLAALPLGRKTSFAEGISEFRKQFGGIYSDQALELMEKTDGR